MSVIKVPKNGIVVLAAARSWPSGFCITSARGSSKNISKRSATPTGIAPIRVTRLGLGSAGVANKNIKGIL